MIQESLPENARTNIQSSLPAIFQHQCFVKSLTVTAVIHSEQVNGSRKPSPFAGYFHRASFRYVHCIAATYHHDKGMQQNRLSGVFRHGSHFGTTDRSPAFCALISDSYYRKNKKFSIALFKTALHRFSRRRY